jgi:molecular chaperone GrpE
MLQRLRQWLFEGTLDGRIDPLEVNDSLEGSYDQLEAASLTLRNTVAEFERQIEALQRRRAADEPPGGRASATSEAELRNHARSMLPTLDALDRIIEFGDSMANKGDAFENWLTSIKALRTRLLKTMEGIGLIAISSVGTEVDLEIHDVVAVVPAGNFPANTVVSEQQRGYYFRNKLLRDAKVVVAQ